MSAKHYVAVTETSANVAMTADIVTFRFCFFIFIFES